MKNLFSAEWCQKPNTTKTGKVSIICKWFDQFALQDLWSSTNYFHLHLISNVKICKTIKSVCVCVREREIRVNASVPVTYVQSLRQQTECI